MDQKRKCEVCGADVEHGWKRSTTCSPSCAASRRKRRQREKQGITDEMVANRKCEQCGSGIPLTLSFAAKYCSARCGASAMKSRRSNQGFNHYSGDRFAIADRDRWRCYICGEEIKKGATRPDPMSLEVDHLMPLRPAAGHEPGSTESWNLAASHGVCNRRKGNRQIPEAVEKMKENRIALGLDS